MIIGICVFAYFVIGGLTCGLQWMSWPLENKPDEPAAIVCGLVWPFALPAIAVMLSGRAVAWLFAPRPKLDAVLPKSLPDDVADAYESMRYAIVQHAADGWRMISPEEVCDTLLVLAEFVEEQV